MNQSESKNGNHTKIIPQELVDTQQPTHRHNLRDRKHRKRAQVQDVPKLPSLIPISQTTDLQLTLTEELGVWHLVVRVPLIKWVADFEEQLCRVQLDELPLLITVRNSSNDQYLCVSLQFLGADASGYVDLWGKVLWTSKVQLVNKVIKRVRKNITDQPTTVVKMKVLDAESDIFLDMGLSRNRSQARQYQGLINQGNTCYMNSYLQMLYHLDTLRNMVFQIQDTVVGKFPATLQSVFYRLATDSKPVSTEQLSKSYGWTKKETWVQQDIQEFSCLFFQVLERKINEQKKLHGSFNQLFEGELTHYVECIDVDYRSEKSERFIDLQLSVEGTGTLLQSLNHFTGYEVLDGDNMYFTERFGKQRAHKGIIISRLPPVVMIQLKRFEYNPYTERNEKVLSRYEYPEQFDFSPIIHKPTPVYKLYAVLVHQGERASSGHYYAYLRLRGKWYKFNDEVVTEASEKEVFEYNFGGQLKTHQLDPKQLIIMEKVVPVDSTAYMLVYCSTEEQPTIFKQQKLIPSWLKEQNQSKMEQQRVKKLKSEMVKIHVTDWGNLIINPVTSCGLFKQLDTTEPEAQYDRYAIEEVPKEQTFDQYAETLRAHYGANDQDISFWLVQESADKELLLNPYSKKQTPTMHDLFRQNANTSLLILSKDKTAIVDDELKHHYRISKLPKDSSMSRQSQFDLEAYRQNQLVVFIVKLYQVSDKGHQSFNFDTYYLLRKDFTYSEVLGLLRSSYDRTGSTIRFFLEGKGHYSISELDEASFVGADYSRNKLIRVIVERLPSSLDKEVLTLGEYFAAEQLKINVKIRSQQSLVEESLYLNKNMSLEELRHYIFTNLCKDIIDIESPEYMVIRSRTSKSSKAMNEVFAGNLDELTRYDKLVLYGKSSIKSSQRESNSVVPLIYRFKTMSRSEHLSTKISKSTTADQLLALIDELSMFKQCQEQDRARKLRLVLLDNLEQKVMRIISGNAEVVQVLSKSKCHMYVEGDEEAAEDDFTVFCHHKAKTGEALPNPFVIRCPRESRLAQLRHLVMQYCRDLTFSFDGKVHKLQPSKLRFNVYPKGSSSTRSTEIFEDSADMLPSVFSTGHELSVQITHLGISKQIQSMRLNV